MDQAPDAAAIAVTATATIPQLGFNHEDLGQSFVLDVADGPRGVVRVTAFAIAGTGIAQLIGWGVGQWLAGGALGDLFPDWHGERFRLFAFHPSRKHPPA